MSNWETLAIGEFDRHLDSALIGDRESVRVVIADYDAGWPGRFNHERERIEAALGDLLIRVEHIGSTSVPGLAAKPVIDVLVTVPDPDAEASFAPQLESAGYVLRVREPGHRMFRTPERDVHIHVWADRDPEVDRYLSLREHLRRSETDRIAYERLKRSLALREWADMNYYASAKTELIEGMLARAASRSQAADS